jgi:hypothetical protein
MSDQESDVALSHLTNSKLQQTKIFLELLPNGHIFVDWSDLPIHRNSRQCVLHYKSLNNNRVKNKIFFFKFIFIDCLESCDTCIT